VFFEKRRTIIRRLLKKKETGNQGKRQPLGQELSPDANILKEGGGLKSGRKKLSQTKHGKGKGARKKNT